MKKVAIQSLAVKGQFVNIEAMAARGEDTSDSEEEDERKLDLKRRMRKFQEKKQQLEVEKARKDAHVADDYSKDANEKAGDDDECELCCQIVMEEDYMEYTGLPHHILTAVPEMTVMLQIC